jgi:hypothetical protein
MLLHLAAGWWCVAALAQGQQVAIAPQADGLDRSSGIFWWCGIFAKLCFIFRDLCRCPLLGRAIVWHFSHAGGLRWLVFVCGDVPFVEDAALLGFVAAPALEALLGIETLCNELGRGAVVELGAPSSDVLPLVRLLL